MTGGTEEAAAIKAAEAIFQLAKRYKLLNRLAASLKTKHKVLVLGSTGTEKTNFN